MHVLYIGPFAQRTGYAQAAHDYMLALHRAGVSLEIQPIVECDTENLEERYGELLPLVRGYPGHVSGSPTHVVVHTVPAHAHRFGLDYPAKRRVCITTWETDEAPKEIVSSLNAHFDGVVVPSSFCAWALRALENKVFVVGHCFDPAHWPRSDKDPYESPYLFYSILGWSERKNPIGLLKAYFAAFTVDDDVALLLKVSGFNEGDLVQLRLATGIPLHRLPVVDVVTDYYDHEEMVDLHEMGRCFVTAARGEGWNLPAFEATLMGNQVIAPRFGGHRSFLENIPQYREIRHQLTPAVTPPFMRDPVNLEGLRVRPVVRSQSKGLTVHQWWAEPNLESLAEAMLKVYDEKPERDESARSYLENEFGYDNIARKLIAVLDKA